MSKRLMEALASVVVEESVRVFLPRLLPYVWFAILVLITIETMRSQSVSKRLMTLWKWVHEKNSPVAYCLMVGLAAGSLLSYAYLSHLAYRMLERKNQETTQELAGDIVKLMPPPPPPKTNNIVQLAPESLTTADKVSAIVTPADKNKIKSTKPHKQGSPTTSQNCQNGGICIGGDNNGTAVVNNGSSEFPKVSWTTDTSTPIKEGVTRPAIWIKISIDRPFMDAKFAAICDRPCEAIGGRVIASHGGYIEDSWGSLPEFPNVAAFVISGPNPLSASDSYLACIESKDEKAVKILEVRPLNIRRTQ